jgi:hypothetical protein
MFLCLSVSFLTILQFRRSPSQEYEPAPVVQKQETPSETKPDISWANASVSDEEDEEQANKVKLNVVIRDAALPNDPSRAADLKRAASLLGLSAPVSKNVSPCTTSIS